MGNKEENSGDTMELRRKFAAWQVVGCVAGAVLPVLLMGATAFWSHAARLSKIESYQEIHHEKFSQIEGQIDLLVTRYNDEAEMLGRIDERLKSIERTLEVKLK